MALRDQFRTDAGWAALDAEPHSDRDLRDVADVATGVPSTAAARFLLTPLRRDDQLRNEPPDALRPPRCPLRGRGDRRGADQLHRRSAECRPPPPGGAPEGGQQGIEERGAKPAAETQNLAESVATALLDSPKGTESLAGIQLASTFRMQKLEGRLTALAREKKADESSRTAAMSALATMAPKPTIALLSQILSDPSETFPLREKVVATLGTLARPASDSALLTVLPTAPARLQTAIAAGLAARPAGAAALLDAVAAGKASARVLQEPRVARPPLPLEARRREAAARGPAQRIAPRR